MVGMYIPVNGKGYLAKTTDYLLPKIQAHDIWFDKIALLAIPLDNPVEKLFR